MKFPTVFFNFLWDGSDASAVKPRKTLRRQFGKFYDAKKVRNNFDTDFGN